MKICWFNEHRLGLVANDRVYDVTAALDALPAPAYPRSMGDHVIAHLSALRAEIERLQPASAWLPLDSVRWLSPVAQPGKIIGVPVNYQAHVEEAERDVATFTDRYKGSVLEQGLFLKATSSLIGAGQAVKISMPMRLTHHEIELAVVIGKTVSNVSRKDALACIAGYCIALDMTVRGPEDRSLRKSLDSYSVLGPWLVTADEIPDPYNLTMTVRINGKERSRGNSGEMHHKFEDILAHVSKDETIRAGEFFGSGTVGSGCALEIGGYFEPGDVIELEVTGLGVLRNRIMGPKQD